MKSRPYLLIAGLGFATALLLAVLPSSYTARETGERVGCGIALAPRNPPPPPGNEDECDVAHVRRWILIIGSSAAGIVGGGAGAIVSAHRRKRAGRKGRPRAGSEAGL